MSFSFKNLKKTGYSDYSATDNLAIVACTDAVTLAPNAYAIHTISNFNRVGKIDANRLQLHVLKFFTIYSYEKSRAF